MSRTAKIAALAAVPAAAVLLSGCAGFHANTRPEAAPATGSATATCTDTGPGLSRAACAAKGMESAWKDAETQSKQADYDRLHEFPFGAWWMWIWGPLIVAGVGIAGIRSAHAEASADVTDGGYAGERITDLTARMYQAAGGLIVGVAAVVLGAHLGGFMGALLVGVPVVLGLVIAMMRSELSEAAIAGHRLEAADWRADQAAAQPIPVPDPWAQYRDLNIPLPPQPDPIVPTIPEPRPSDEEAAARAAHEAETGGWHPVPGSAQEAVTSVSGNIAPAHAAVAKVARDLGWGVIQTTADGRVWIPWVEVAGVVTVGEEDAEIHLSITHSTVTESTIEKALPALVRALRVGHAVVGRDIASGTITLTVTNRAEGFADPEAAAEAEWDPEGW